MTAGEMYCTQIVQCFSLAGLLISYEVTSWLWLLRHHSLILRFHQQKNQTRNISDVSLSQSTMSISLWQIKGAQSTQTTLTFLSFNWQSFLKCSWSSINRWCPTTCMIKSSSKESLEVEATRDLWKYSQDLFSPTAPNSVVAPWGRLLPCQVYS